MPFFPILGFATLIISATAFVTYLYPGLILWQPVVLGIVSAGSGWLSGRVLSKAVTTSIYVALAGSSGVLVVYWLGQLAIDPLTRGWGDNFGIIFVIWFVQLVVSPAIGAVAGLIGGGLRRALTSLVV